MIVEISTETLKDFGISANDYLYLYLLSNKCYEVIVELNLDVELEDLQTKGLIKIGEELQSHTVRDKFINYNRLPEDQMWSELLSYFPLKVSGNRGEVRVLRSKDAESANNSQAKKKYLAYLKGSTLRHKEVVDALKNELDIRNKSNSLFYMQMLNTWVNQRTWEKYIDLKADVTTTPRVTRQL
jgi:hypothetical protein